MKKLNLDGLKVDTFATTAGGPAGRGTVAAREAAPTTPFQCPYSYGGTCVITGCLPCPTDVPCN